MNEYDPERDLYVALEVDSTATDDAIREAHCRRIRTLRPDRDDDPAIQSRGALVNHARDVLLNPASRCTYDRARADYQGRANRGVAAGPASTSATSTATSGSRTAQGQEAVATALAGFGTAHRFADRCAWYGREAKNASTYAKGILLGLALGVDLAGALTSRGV